MRNDLVYEGMGGTGGGSVHIVSRHVDIDGAVTANGEPADATHGLAAGRLQQFDISISSMETKNHYRGGGFVITLRNSDVGVGQVETSIMRM